jgi:hypothetical protein
MKHVTIMSIFIGLIVQISPAQTKRNNKESQVYLTGGIKFLQPKYFNLETNIAPLFVTTIGGGALRQVKKFQFGGEFNYTDGKKQTSAFSSIFTGINFNLISGYYWNLGQKLRLSVQSGFGYSLYHLSFTDKNYTNSSNLNTAIYHNFIYTVPVSVMLLRTNSNGTFAGVRAGYNLNVLPNEWRYMKGAGTEVYRTGNDGYYFQIVLGGLFKSKYSPL